MGKTYYKVVSVIDNKMYSAIHHALKTFDLSVEYKVNEWVYPKLGESKLMVFGSLNDAEDFSSIWKCNIYACKVKNPQKKGPFVSDVYSFDFKTNLLKVIQIKKQKKKYFGIAGHKLGLLGIMSTLPTHDNVVFCDAIMLTERI